jgi:hypothetical protein
VSCVAQETYGRFPEEREANTKVWAVDRGRESLDEDVDDDVGVAQLGLNW